jgi:hypothetical protein
MREDVNESLTKSLDLWNNLTSVIRESKPEFLIPKIEMQSMEFDVGPSSANMLDTSRGGARIANMSQSSIA